jgi:hypothetical protein
MKGIETIALFYGQYHQLMQERSKVTADQA